MSSLKLPIIVWEDGENFYCKLLFQSFLYPGSYNCSVAKQLQEAKKDLIHVAQKIYSTKGWTEYESDLSLHLGTLHVNVKPRIQYPNKIFPSPFPVEVHVPYVWRQDEVGTVDVQFPVWDLSTSFSGSENLCQEAERFIKQKLNETEDNLIYNYKAVRNVRLDDIFITIKSPEKVSSSVKSNDSLLKQTAIELTPAYIKKNYSVAWEMTSYTDRLVQEISKSQSSIVLVGPTSCGKSTVLVNAIRQLSKGNKSISSNHFWLSNDRRLVQGTKWLGEWQQQVKNIIDELAQQRGVLCIENLAQLIENPDNVESSLASFFVPYLRTKQVRLIGEMTPEEYQTMKHVLPEFIDMLEPVFIEPLSYEQGRSMLKSLNAEFMRNHKSYEISEDVASTSAYLFHRFYGKSAFPGPAAQFWQKTIPARQRKKEKSYTTENLYDDFLTHTGMPQWLFRSDIALSYSQIFQDLSKRIIGQPDACSVTANVILRFKTAMNNPKRPIGSFLFCGPTGVGKTQMVKTMTQYLFGNRTVEQTDEKLPDKFIRLDMSEYSLPWTAQSILEKPDGSPSKLIEQVRQNPFSVVLFDEIEKADSGAFDILLNLLDEGRLQDRLGRVTDFKNTIIVMTSNLGSERKDDLGFADLNKKEQAPENPENAFQSTEGQISGTLDMQQQTDSARQNKYRQAVEQFFRPEFVNRIDNIVVFNNLDKKSSKAIVELELSALKYRSGIKERDVQIKPTAGLIDKLIELGFDSQMGARPLQRIIEANVVTLLAQWLIKYPKENNVTLMIDWNSDGATIQKQGDKSTLKDKKGERKKE